MIWDTKVLQGQWSEFNGRITVRVDINNVSSYVVTIVYALVSLGFMGGNAKTR